MSRMLVIARREVASYFVSPIFWVLAAAFMAFFGLVFGLYVSMRGSSAPQAEMGPLLGLVGVVLLFVTPLLAMRLVAEEQHSGTLEVLMTSPVQEWQVIAGKWLAALTVYAVIIGLTLAHVAIMLRLATNGMDPGPLISSYLGLLLLGASLLAVGVLTSALTENQVVAAFLGVMVVMLLYFLGLTGSITGTESGTGQALTYLGLAEHYQNFGQGVIDSRDLIYFGSLTVGALFLAARALESRRWR